MATPAGFIPLDAYGARQFGRLSFVLSKESPPDPERNTAFLRLPIYPRPGAAKCRLNRSAGGRAPTLDTGDVQGLGPARSVTQRLLGGLCPLIMRDFAFLLNVGCRPVTKPTTAAR